MGNHLQIKDQQIPEFARINTLIENADNEQLGKLLDSLTREVATRALRQVDIQGSKIEDIKQELEGNKADMQKLREEQETFIEKSNYFNQIRFSQDYVNLSNLGRKIIPTISNVRMKRLLKWAGILQSNEHIPYQNFLQGKEPMVQQQKGITSTGYEFLNYLYHAERTWRYLDKKLKESGLLAGFKVQKTTTELHTFIDNWCELR
jgi:hypothetical protein